MKNNYAVKLKNKFEKYPNLKDSPILFLSKIIRIRNYF